jgi:hypothetical protein
VFGSLTLTNANWMRPSENSSTRSSSSPSVSGQPPLYPRCSDQFPSSPGLKVDLVPAQSKRASLEDPNCCWNCDLVLRGHVHTSCALDLEHALLAAVALESADQRGGHGEDCPLSVCGRGCLGALRRRGVDDVLVAPCDAGAVAGGVERGHGEGWWGPAVCLEPGRVDGEKKEGESGKNWRRECPLCARRLTGYGARSLAVHVKLAAPPVAATHAQPTSSSAKPDGWHRSRPPHLADSLVGSASPHHPVARQSWVSTFRPEHR